MITRREFLHFAAIFGIPTVNIRKYIGEILWIRDGAAAINVNFKIWLIRPEDLLDLEFGFVNLTRIHGDKSHVQLADPSRDGLMIVRLPQQHISEQTLGSLDPLDGQVTKSFMAGSSYLVFKLNNAALAEFTLTPGILLDWASETYFRLALLDKNEYADSKASFDVTDPYYGLASAGDKPVTTFQVPYGVAIAPLDISLQDKFHGGFSKSNAMSRPVGYVFPKGGETKIADRYFNSLGLGPSTDKNADLARNAPDADEIWYNDLVYKDGGAKLLFKVIDVDTNTSKDLSLLPLLTDKQKYLAQFRTIDKYSDQQLISLVSEQFRISALGLTASLNYVSPDPDDTIHKIYEEIVYGRDQYIEVDRLGYMYPLGLRVLQVSIGRRTIRNGTVYVEQRQYVAPLDRSVVFRSDGDQADISSPGSVLQRTVAGAATDQVNYINSCKRSFPFGQIDVLTNDYIEIMPPGAMTGADAVSADGSGALLGFWPKRRLPDGTPGGDVSFQFSATDWEGKKTVFESPFLFVDADGVKNVAAQYDNKSKAYQALQVAGPRVSEALICLQQELLDDSDEVLDLLSGGGNATVLATKTKDIAVKLYKRYDELASGMTKADKKVQDKVLDALQALSKMTGDSNDFRVWLDNFTTLTDPFSADNSLKTHINCLCTYLFVLQKIGQAGADRAALRARVSATQAKIAWLESALDQTAKQRYYRVVQAYYDLDRRLELNYHSEANALRREVAIQNQKISYYKAILNADAEQKVNELETAVMAFSAVPLSKIAEFKAKARDVAEQLQAGADAGLQKISDFGGQYYATYPQLLAAQVKLPVVDQLMNDSRTAAAALASGTAALQQKYAATRLAVIGYADAYRVAGIEGWQGGEAVVKMNAERVLFDVQDALISPAAGEAQAAFDAAQNAYEKKIKAPWESLNMAAQDFEANTIGFAKSSIGSIFQDASAKVGGVVNPGVVIEHVSAVRDKMYALKNDLNAYTGEINTYLVQGAADARAGVADIQAYEDQLKNAVIGDKNYLANLLKDIQLFGFSVTDLLSGDIHFTPDMLPQSTINVKKQDGITIGSTINYEWTSKNKKLFDDGQGAVKFLNGGKPADTVPAFIDLHISDTVSFELVPAKVTNTLHSSVGLENFGISALDIITIYFTKLSYTKDINSTRDSGGNWTTSTNSTFSLQIAQVEFDGFLTLIKQLEDMLGIGNNFLLDVGLEGIMISYGISIPNICTGGFTMSNMNLYAGLALSFQGKPPAMRFAFSDRANPFTLAAGIYGGRGFFAIYVNSQGLQRLEASLEFGGYFALDIAGIAKGQAYLMAGIYFSSGKELSAVVEAYVTCGGSLSIVGLIHVSVVFYLGMAYQNGGLRGFASVEVSVSILFFSASYNLTFEKHITGSSGVSFNGDRGSSRYRYLALNDTDHDAYLEEVFSEAPAADNELYCWLFIEDHAREWDELVQADGDTRPKLIPVYDPTLLYEEDMDFTKYVNQFGN